MTNSKIRMTPDLAKLDSAGAELIAENADQTTQVWKHQGQYFVFNDGEIKHPKCNAEDVIRALCHYLN